jgi:site-specific recombinase XerD
MGLLRDRMEAEMKLRGYSPSTRDSYLRYMQRFVEYYGGRSPLRLGANEVRGFLLDLLERQKATPSVHHMCVAAIRFFYVSTLKRPEVVADVRFPKVPRALPEILTGEEVERLLNCITSIRNRTMAALAYAAGLRITEICRLKPEDIDSDRGLIHVRRGKGDKPRQVMLSARLLLQLREYWRIVRPQGPYLFPGPEPDKPISDSAVRKALDAGRQAAGIKKRVSPHRLRHSFATHLLDMGVGLASIQALLGHSSVRTTTRYTQVSSTHIAGVKSPFDVLGTEQGKPLK